ncbi:MAG: 30S ribosome-binding factor RbfA [Patescibacteria group bacterium]
MSNRIEKVDQLIRKELAEIINKELTLKAGIFVSISSVKCSRDLKNAQVQVSVYPDKEEDYVLKTLNKEIYKLQGALNKKLKMKPLPKIFFVTDHSQERVEELEEIFKRIKEEE